MTAAQKGAETRRRNKERRAERHTQTKAQIAALEEIRDTSIGAKRAEAVMEIERLRRTLWY